MLTHVLYLLLSLSCITPFVSASIACNNSPSLCSRTYDNITHLGAHDSPFLRDASTAYSDSGDQYVNSTIQLSAGVRLLTGQIFYVNETEGLHLCHTECALLDAGRLSDWLADIKTWLDDNPNEVVTLLLVNGDDSSADTIATEFTSADITPYAYTPPSVSTPPAYGAWPTLTDLITADTRLVTFIASLTTLSTSATYLLSEFDFIFENPYEYTNLTSFTCTPQRPSSVSGSTSAALAANLLPLQNHFVYTDEGFGIDVPDVTDIYVTNAPVGSVNASTGSLGASAQACADGYGRAPTFVLVDYFNVGPAVETVDALNGVTDATGRTEVADSTDVSASDSSASSSTSSGAGRGLKVGFEGRVIVAVAVAGAVAVVVGLAGW